MEEAFESVKENVEYQHCLTRLTHPLTVLDSAWTAFANALTALEYRVTYDETGLQKAVKLEEPTQQQG